MHGVSAMVRRMTGWQRVIDDTIINKDASKALGGDVDL